MKVVVSTTDKQHKEKERQEKNKNHQLPRHRHIQKQEIFKSPIWKHLRRRRRRPRLNDRRGASELAPHQKIKRQKTTNRCSRWLVAVLSCSTSRGIRNGLKFPCNIKSSPNHNRKTIASITYSGVNNEEKELRIGGTSGFLDWTE